MMSYDPSRIGCRGGWQKYTENPIIGDVGDFCFDNQVLSWNGHYRMYFSWRTHYGIAYTESDDGLHWGERKMVMYPRKDISWEEDVNRPSLIQCEDGSLMMWYSAQTAGGFNSGKWTDNYIEASLADSGTSVIALATSKDGETWERLNEPVLVPERLWEKNALMNPTVLWDPCERLYKMWYCGGGWFEPDCIGYATSTDGIHWTKHESNPVFTACLDNLWEQSRVAGCNMIFEDGWYQLFYIGYEDLFKARIGLARSKNGINGWQRHPANPIISGGMPSAWDCEAAYKACVIWNPEKKRWQMYFNARTGTTERIGIAFHDGRNLWE